MTIIGGAHDSIKLRSNSSARRSQLFRSIRIITVPARHYQHNILTTILITNSASLGSMLALDNCDSLWQTRWWYDIFKQALLTKRFLKSFLLESNYNKQMNHPTPQKGKVLVYFDLLYGWVVLLGDCGICCILWKSSLSTVTSNWPLRQWISQHKRNNLPYMYKEPKFCG